MCPRTGSRPDAGNSDDNAEGRRQRARRPSKRNSPKRITAATCRQSTATNAAVERHRTCQRQREAQHQCERTDGRDYYYTPTRSKERPTRSTCAGERGPLPHPRRGQHDPLAPASEGRYHTQGETNTIHLRRRARAVTTPKERPTRSTAPASEGRYHTQGKANTIHLRRRARAVTTPQHDPLAPASEGRYHTQGESNTIHLRRRARAVTAPQHDPRAPASETVTTSKGTPTRPVARVRHVKTPTERPTRSEHQRARSNHPERTPPCTPNTQGTPFWDTDHSNTHARNNGGLFISRNLRQTR